MAIPITSEAQSDYLNVRHDAASELTFRIKQAALEASVNEIDHFVKQIGCDKLGEDVAKATQAALEDAKVSVSWIPRTHDCAGSLLMLNEKWGAAFSSEPSVRPEGVSLMVNELALKRGDFDELFTVTAVSPEQALQALIVNALLIH